MPSDGCLLVSADYCQLELRYLPQSKELIRGPPELVQHFLYMGEFTSGGSSHLRKSAACPKFDMVWQKSLAYPSGEEGGSSSFK